MAQKLSVDEEKSDSEGLGELLAGKDKKESAFHSPSFWLVTRVWPYEA